MWKAEFKYLVSNLERSIGELTDIIKKLDTLKKDCEKTKGNIKHKVQVIKNKMLEKIKAKEKDI